MAHIIEVHHEGETVTARCRACERIIFYAALPEFAGGLGETVTGHRRRHVRGFRA